jgi:hypothetical protein
MMGKTESTRLGSKGRKINISQVKLLFSSRFPNLDFTKILLSEPDELSTDELVAKIGTWLLTLDEEKGRIFISSMRNNTEEYNGRK